MKLFLSLTITLITFTSAFGQAIEPWTCVTESVGLPKVLDCANQSAVHENYYKHKENFIPLMKPIQ